MNEMAFERDGAERCRAALSTAGLKDIQIILAGLHADQAGIRLRGVTGLLPSLGVTGEVGRVASDKLGSTCRPVRAILFDKTPTTNWSLPWHQDRTISVVKRIDVAGFGPWSIKQGMLHVAPPFEILADMVTVRVHLDPVPVSNSPLLMAPGSHRLERVPESRIADAVKHCGTHVCLADAGDVWVYSTPILHASEVSQDPSHRSVLQIDYARGGLPGGLQWLGV